MSQKGSDDDDNQSSISDADQEAIKIGQSSSHISKKDSLSVHDIDAFWLQRLLSTTYSDEHEASQKADAAMAILASEVNSRDRENSLMELFDYDKFEIVETLIRHRDIIFWCTKLARAEAHNT